MSPTNATTRTSVSYDPLTLQLSSLSLTEQSRGPSPVDPISLPVTCESISKFMEQDSEVRTLKNRMDLGCRPNDNEFLEKIAKIVNEMAQFAKKINMKNEHEFIYTRYGTPKNSPPTKIRVSTLPFNTSNWKQEGAIMRIIPLIWLRAFDVSVNAAYVDYYIDFSSSPTAQSWNTLRLVWASGNTHLLPRPKFDKPILTNTSQKDFNTEHTDVCFIVEGNPVPAHTACVAQSAYLRTMLTGNFKESRERHAIRFEGADHKTFVEFLHFLYTGKVRPEILQNVPDCLALLEFAAYTKEDHLKNICIANVFELISKESFIPIAVTQMKIDDEDLARLCNWFPQVYPNFAQRLDLETLFPNQLLVLHNLATKYQIKGLDTRCTDCLQRRITLDKGTLGLKCTKAG